MIRLEGKATFTDGSSVDLVAGQFEFAAWERFALRAGMPVQPGQAPPITLLQYLGYAAIQKQTGKLQPDWPSFEEWQLTIDDVTLEAPEGTATAVVPPTLTGVLAE